MDEAKSNHLQSSSPQSAASHLDSSRRIAGDLETVEWHVAVGKKQLGPYSVQQVHAMINQGQLPADALVWKPGMESWLSLTKCDEFPKALATDAKNE